MVEKQLRWASCFLWGLSLVESSSDLFGTVAIFSRGGFQEFQFLSKAVFITDGPSSKNEGFQHGMFVQWMIT
jgi:hypothetical protein